jgi:DNA (cytosine-5)-methyltransferase 1
VNRPRLLDLCCREGGAGEGYRRAGFEVVGVDVERFDYQPGTFVQADAVEYLREHGHEFDAVHGSPPCQRWINRGNSARVKDQAARVDLLTPLRAVLVELGKPYVLENVPGAVRCGAMRCDVLLCGSMFPNLAVQRHRAFEFGGWDWARLMLLPACDHSRPVAGVYGHLHGSSGAWPGMLPSTLESWRAAMGMDWATAEGMREAIPPDYTELIGGELLRYLAGSTSRSTAALPVCPALT